MTGDKKTGAAEKDGKWKYKPVVGGGETGPAPASGSGPQPAAASGTAEDGAVEWSASEFIAHEKGFGWYALLVLVAAVVAAGIYIATRDMFSTAVVVIMATIFGVAGAHKPRVITYRLDAEGLTAGKKFYPYRNYKSFTMPDDGPFVSIMLTPMKRFDFPTGAFLAPDNQKQALDLLSEHLPLERGEPGLVDTLMRQLRF